MVWLQENWVAALVVAIVAIAIIGWLVARRGSADTAPTIEPAKPAKPLEPVKPEIVAAEPARFKPIEPAPAPKPVAPPPPAAAPIPEAPAPVEPTPAPPPAEPETAPPEPPTEPVAKAAPPPVEPAPAVADEPVAAPPEPAATAKADNLQLIKGLGPKLATLLNGLGVSSFQQIADWTDADIAAIDPQLGAFQGRIARDNFVDQAGYLVRGDKTGFEARYGALGGEI